MLRHEAYGRIALCKFLFSTDQDQKIHAEFWTSQALLFQV